MASSVAPLTPRKAIRSSSELSLVVNDTETGPPSSKSPPNKECLIRAASLSSLLQLHPLVCSTTAPCLKATAPPSLKRESFFFVDWDDTIFPTSWLESWVGPILNPTTIPRQLPGAMVDLCRCIRGFFTSVTRYGTIVIITNSEKGWVERTTDKYLAPLKRLMAQTKVVSARSTFESRFPGAPRQWKAHAMSAAVRETLSSSGGSSQHVQLISIGDAEVERASVKAASHMVSRDPRVGKCCAKSVKLIQRPLLSHVQLQLQILQRKLPMIFGASGELDLVLGASNTKVLHLTP